ncbi:MAG: hypothetical protein ABII27_00970 [bacterium]
MTEFYSALASLISNLKIYVELGENSICIKPLKSNNFLIGISEDNVEYTLFFDGWHTHFPKNQDGQNSILSHTLFALTKQVRLKIYERGCFKYKFVPQSLSNGKWKNWPSLSIYKMNRFFIWERRNIIFLQNDYTTKEIIDKHFE